MKIFKVLLQFFLVTFQCAAIVCTVLMWHLLNGVTVFNCESMSCVNRLYCSNGMFYQRKYKKCKTFAQCISTNDEKDVAAHF